MEGPGVKGALLAVTLLGSGLGYSLPDIMPDPPFLNVRALEYNEAQVFFDRAIVPPDVWADWSVAVFLDDVPKRKCEGDGTSHYEAQEPRQKVFTLDDFVGDPGCSARLVPGRYTAFVTWTPLDGRRPVSAQFRFQVP